VVVTSWTDARIPWPRCRVADRAGGGGSGLLVDEELARAVRHEGAAAICHWWGVTDGVVSRWRKTLGVTLTSCPGTRRLMRGAAKLGAAEVQAMYRRRRRERQARQSRRGDQRRTGADARTRCEPTEAQHRPRPRRVFGARPLTAEEDALVRELPTREAAQRTGRTLPAVIPRRRILKVPDGRTRESRARKAARNAAREAAGGPSLANKVRRDHSHERGNGNG
jgi:hypothetical protein